MADTVQFDLVSPERLLASTQAKEVQIPGAEGDMTAMPDHAPLITTLRPGVLKVSGSDGDAAYVVTGGFAEINASSISVLAERAIPQSEVTQEQFAEMMGEANARLEKAQAAESAEPGQVDDAAKFVADMAALGAEIGMSAA
ncbi:MAG: F0F1 ATP synthase subunit epsilon [Pseudomonadota bacterium]